MRHAMTIMKRRVQWAERAHTSTQWTSGQGLRNMEVEFDFRADDLRWRKNVAANYLLLAELVGAWG